MVDFFFLDLEARSMTLCFLGYKEHAESTDYFSRRMVGFVLAVTEERLQVTGG